MLLQEQSMILMVKGMMSCPFVLVIFFDLLPRGSNLASGDGFWEQWTAMLRGLFLLTMSRLVYMYVMLVLYTDMGSMIYNALVRGAMIKKKKKRFCHVGQMHSSHGLPKFTGVCCYPFSTPLPWSQYSNIHSTFLSR